MELFFSNASPYARKVRIALIEKGLEGQVVMSVCNPFDDDQTLKSANPLSKVPTLVLADGQALYDSSVICAYVDSLAPVSPLISTDAPARWRTLRIAALADGILDAAFASVMESRRPAPQQSSMWLERWSLAIARSIKAAEADAAELSGDVTLAQIGLGAALGYLDFRLPDIAWRAGRPGIARWFEDFSKRPSMQQSHPEN